MGKKARNYSQPDLKKLFLLARNKCSKCQEELVQGSQVIAEICHIEDANPGCRYNPEMSDAERCAYDNLILLCRNCHKITNDEHVYSVDVLKNLKDQHIQNVSTVESSEHLLEQFLRSMAYSLDYNESVEWGVLEEIITHAVSQVSHPFTSEEQIIKHHRFLNTKEKAQLNFPKSQLIRFGQTFKSSTARKESVEAFMESMSSEDSIRRDDLIEFVINKYCEIIGDSNPERKVGDINNLALLAKEILPEAKRNSPEYMSASNALVIYIFEICSFGAKTKKETSNEQQSLFS